MSCPAVEAQDADARTIGSICMMWSSEIVTSRSYTGSAAFAAPTDSHRAVPNHRQLWMKHIVSPAIGQSQAKRLEGCLRRWSRKSCGRMGKCLRVLEV